MNAHQRRIARRALARRKEATRAMLAAVFPGVRISDAFEWRGGRTGRFVGGPRAIDSIPRTK